VAQNLGSDFFVGQVPWWLPLVNADNAIIARREASRQRTLAFQTAAADAALYHTLPSTRAFHEAERRFTPGFYWTPVWTDEAREAFYRHLSRFA